MELPSVFLVDGRLRPHPNERAEPLLSLIFLPIADEGHTRALIHPSASVRYSNRRRTLPHSREIYPLLTERSTVLKQADFNFR